MPAENQTDSTHYHPSRDGRFPPLLSTQQCEEQAETVKSKKTRKRRKRKAVTVEHTRRTARRKARDRLTRSILKSNTNVPESPRSRSSSVDPPPDSLGGGPQEPKWEIKHVSNHTLSKSAWILHGTHTPGGQAPESWAIDSTLAPAFDAGDAASSDWWANMCIWQAFPQFSPDIQASLKGPLREKLRAMGFDLDKKNLMDQSGEDDSPASGDDPRRLLGEHSHEAPSTIDDLALETEELGVGAMNRRSGNA